MKNTTTLKTTKTVAIIFMFATILGVFAIFPSAQTEELVIERGYYIFNEDINFGSVDNLYEIPIDFVSDGATFDTLAYDSNYQILYAQGSDYFTAFSQGEWMEENYRIIFIIDNFYPDHNFYEFFTQNTKPISNEDLGVKKGMYKDIEYVLTSTIYDADFEDLDSYQRLTITNLSTIACVAVVALPLIVIFWLLKFVFSLFKYF